MAASVVSYGALLTLALFGFHRLGAARSRTPGLWLLSASAVGVALVFFPQERFRIPVIDPTLIVSAAALWKGRTETPPTASVSEPARTERGNGAPE